MTYTAGLVGAGRIGRIHAELYANRPGVDLISIAEVDPELSEERGQAWGIGDDRRYEGHHAMLENVDLDIVSIAAPTPLHHEIVLDIAQAPSPPSVILCEKPLAERPRDARTAVRTCEDADIDLVVDHTLRFSEAFNALQEHIQSGEMGQIHSVQLHASGSLFRLGTHYVDLLCYLLDDRVERVTGGVTSPYTRDPADEDVDDRWGAFTLSFAGGTLAQVDLTRSGCVANQLTIVGDAATAVLRGSDATSIFNRAFELDYRVIEDGEHVQATPPIEFDQLWAADMSQKTSGSDMDRGMYAAQQQFNRVGEHLVALLDGEADNRSSGQSGAHVVEVLTAAVLSAEFDTAVAVPVTDVASTLRVSSR